VGLHGCRPADGAQRRAGEQAAERTADDEHAPGPGHGGPLMRPCRSGLAAARRAPRPLPSRRPGSGP
jgi:hypothetical protein